MMTTRIIYIGIILLQVIFLLGSCTQKEQELETIVYSHLSDKIPMVFTNSKPCYDETTRSTNDSWYVGDTLYVELQAGGVATGKNILGRATISPVTGQWEIEFSKQYVSTVIPETGTCRAWYLKGEYYNGSYSAASFILKVTPHTAIYVDKDARYSYEKSKFTLIADLAPLTSRIRFTSTKKTEIKFKGTERVRRVQYYETPWEYGPDYDCIYSVERSSQPTTISVDKIDSDGMYSSEYVYGLLTNEYDNFSMMDLADPEKVYFLQNSLLSRFSGSGLTGKIQIPDRTNHDGWEMKDNFIKTLANDVDLTGSYAKQSFYLGQVTGYGIRCDVDLSKDHAWFKILAENPDTYGGNVMWSSYDYCEGVAFKGTLSLDIPFKKNYTDNQTITFEHYYSPHGTREKFTNVKLYYFSF